MLSILRKHAASTIIKIILALIIIVFVFWGFEGFRADQSGRVAAVNGQAITIDQYRETYNNLLDRYRQQFGGQLNDELIEMFQLRQQALDLLINQKLMEMEAQRLNFRVSDEALADHIRNIEAFQSDGIFDSRRYQDILRRIRTTPEQFEEQQRQALLIQKLQDFIVESVKVSDDEVMEFFKWNNTLINIKYTLFDPLKYEVEVADEETLRSYFEENQEVFRTRPMRKVRFVQIQPGDYVQEIEVSEWEIRQYYDDNLDEFIAQGAVSFDEVEDQIKNELMKSRAEVFAREVAENVHDDSFLTDDLVRVAQRHGVEVRTTDFFTDTGPLDENIEERRKFGEIAFSLFDTEVSEIHRLSDGYYIMQLMDIKESRIPSFEEIEEKVKENWIFDKQNEMAQKDATKFLEALRGGMSMEDISEDFNVVVSESDFFGRNQPIPGLGNEPGISMAAFELSEEKKYPETILRGEKGYYVIAFQERKEPSTQNFEQEKEYIRQRMLIQKQTRTFEDWIAQIRHNSKISINTEFITR